MKANVKAVIYLIVNIAITYLLFWIMVWVLLYIFHGSAAFYIPHLTIVLMMFGLNAGINYLLIKLLKIKGRYTLLISTIEIAVFYMGYWYLFGYWS
jgi:hypothetical protein